MTQSIIRIYDSESQGSKAAEHLRKEGYADVFQFSSAAGKGAAAARSNLIASMMAAHIWRSHAEAYADRLTKGKSMVLVHAPFGGALNAMNVMDTYQPSETGISEAADDDEYKWDDKAPLSSALHLPVLMKNKYPAETLSGVSSLTKGKAFLSDLLGIKLLTAGSARKNTSMGLPLLTGAATPLSSAIGMPTLSQNPTPLSSLFGLPVLKKSR
jgi:hypothetical protein